MNLNVFGLKEEEWNVAKAVENGSQSIANVSFVGQKSFKCLQ